MPKVTINKYSSLDRKSTIANYSFSECLNLLIKLQQLNSEELQTVTYQQLIECLENRIKHLAQTKLVEQPTSYAVQQAV